MAKLFGDDYNGTFSPISYMSERYVDLDTEWNLFQLDNSFRQLRHSSVIGSKLLDLGCGPNLINVIAAPDNFNYIVMADFSQDNLDFIRHWFRGDQSEFTWQHVCDHYSIRHGLGDNWKKCRLGKLKTYLKEFVECDVLKPEPLGPKFTGFFDCLTTSFCLETASRDFKSYTQSVGNVVSLLQNGGHLIMRGVLDEEGYVVGNKTFHTLPLNLEQVKEALEAAGMGIIELNCETPKYETPCFSLIAQKK